MRAVAVSFATLALLVGCSSANDQQSTSTPKTSIGEGGDRGGAPSTGAGGEYGGDGSGGSAGPISGGGGTGTTPQPGTLTAGAWDDNLNFDFYLSYVEKNASVAGAPKIPRADRLRIDVADGAGLAVGGATVVVRAGALKVFEGPTGSDGHVDVYPAWATVAAGTALQIEASLGSIRATASALAGDKTVKLGLAGASATLPPAVDVALMIDTTGSMGDEIVYLRTEIAAIAKAVSAGWPTVSQRWATVAYKDEGDTYVVKSSPFTSDPAAIQAQIAALSADGGGDYPEAPDQALDATSKLEWRAGNVARLVFWIADAPHHVGNEAAIVQSIQALRAKGVHVYPIAASGTDDLTELTMRSAAQLTAGRYLFLTDDSGVGGTHKEPSIPCYFVTRLDNAMKRMIAAELTGAYVAPTAAEILRTGGDPKDGRCTLTDGQQVVIY